MRLPTRGLAAAWLCAAACSTPSDRPWDATAELPDLLPWLVPGTTTREQALLELGLPMERFEDDRILAWRVVRTARNGSAVVSQFVSPWYGSSPRAETLVEVDPRVRIEAPEVRSLLLVFDERGVLRRQVLLQQR